MEGSDACGSSTDANNPVQQRDEHAQGIDLENISVSGPSAQMQDLVQATAGGRDEGECSANAVRQPDDDR